MRYSVYSLFSLLFFAQISHATSPELLIKQLQIPADFQLSIYAEVPEARSLAVDEKTGTVYVGSRSGNTIHAILDVNKDFKSDVVIPLLTDLNSPNGVAVHPQTGDLYIVEQHQIRQISANQLTALSPQSHLKSNIIFNALPDKRWHGWRYAKFSPTGYLYVAVGAPCNICDVQGIEGTIIRLDVSTSNAQMAVFARGIRNSVGFDFHPISGELYFTDNGADNLGDLIPPCELNHAPQAGLHFGYPYVWGVNNTPYPDSKKRQPPMPSTMTAPIVAFDAHAAPLGIHFIRGKNYPKNYQTSALVAQHGSWNRNPADPAGYKVVRVQFDEQGKVINTQDFITGWLDSEKKAWGRPVDIAQLADGSLLISDDRAGLIYRLQYVGKN
ncbi:PQQ-dependent sugar dehydrogenase [Beggiatoa leptomitoformis]|uniref:Sorbosone dehydrogenase family protein n=1 Tax=Beggiatoa leptomitoformis TaxID=288004 RepID=A0A2N9YBL0_9GAMM|nr:PQQ-dependent sugar dehydrogenase [Beggiatoa leptomitoformis]ALG69296.2 sorbosone dehydrogenase family protein [Beggiatoa leptomitoformis]AUI67822.1 sorbosone dehydrogenase family protein [Beggiatoa leptomitoformis]